MDPDARKADEGYLNDILRRHDAADGSIPPESRRERVYQQPVKMNSRKDCPQGSPEFGVSARKKVVKLSYTQTMGTSKQVGCRRWIASDGLKGRPAWNSE